MSLRPANGPAPEQIELILREVRSLPPLAPVATRLLSTTADSSVDLGEIARLIEADPVLSARILGLCRRAERGVNEKITSVRRAVVLVGLEAVKSAALAATAFGALAPRADASPRFQTADFWRFSVGVAVTAELLAVRHRAVLRVLPEEAFLCGLLQGLGRLVLHHVLPRAYDRVLAIAERDGLATAPIEQRVLGIDAQQAALALAEHWGLPQCVVDVLARPAPETVASDRPRDPMQCLIDGAVALVRGIGLGWCGDCDEPASAADLLAPAGVASPDLEEIAPQLLRGVADRLQALDVDSGTPEALALSALSAARRESRVLRAMLRTAVADLRDARRPDPGLAGTLEAAQQTIRGIGETTRHLTTISSRTRLLAMRLQDPRDRAGVQAIVEAVAQLEKSLEGLQAITPPRSAAA